MIIVLKGIANAREFRNLILAYRHQYVGDLGGGGGREGVTGSGGYKSPKMQNPEILSALGDIKKVLVRIEQQGRRKNSSITSPR